MRQLADRRGAARLYRDFVQIYERTSAVLDPPVLALIAQLAAPYGSDAAQAEIVFAILYATMVAEENKHKAVLRKRIKRLAVHQMLIEDMPVMAVVVWSKGKRWPELDAACQHRGF